jgi:hypothetical protein
VAATGSIVGGWLLGAAAHRVSTRTGVWDVEAYGSLPGDDFIPHPMVEWTRGITVRTTPERVWPWLAQMGYGRGGWYTPQWVDLFANRWVFGYRTPFPPSANRLLPEYQHVAVGNIICDGPNHAFYFSRPTGGSTAGPGVPLHPAPTMSMANSWSPLVAG